MTPPAVWDVVHRLTISITDFGDSAVTLPVALVTAVFLVACREPRPALAWAGAVGGCGAAMLGLKLLLAGRPHDHFPWYEWSSPSGHAAMSAVIYGGLAVLLYGSLEPRLRRLAPLVAALLVAAIAVSRIALRDHSVVETALGLAVGGMALAGLRWALAAQPARRLPAVWLGAAALATMLVMHGTRWRAERAIDGFARPERAQDVATVRAGG